MNCNCKAHPQPHPDSVRLDRLQQILRSGDDVSLIGGPTVLLMTDTRIKEYRDVREALDSFPTVEPRTGRSEDRPTFSRMVVRV